MNVIEKIHEFERFGSVLGLARMEVLMELLGNPQDELSCIHVAGTNGKGSVCRYIYEALEENGYTVGLYTSPFLEDFNERIEFDRKKITDEELTECTDIVLEKVEEMKARGCDSPTEFEVITAVAFVYFARKRPDFVVLEVGLGGRGDSTNIIKKPLVSVITSISFDHMDRLGDTLAAIAAEKAGIIKAGVPVVANVADHEAAVEIARKAYKMGCVLYDVSKIKHSDVIEVGTWLENDKAPDGYDFIIEGQCFDVNIGYTEFGSLELSMLGEHQIRNAISALQTLEILRRMGIIKIEKAKLYAGMKKARQNGRFEILRAEQGKPFIIIDGAHNEDGAKALLATMERHFKGKSVFMVAGMLADKDTDAIVGSFTKIASDFIATEPESPRKLPAASLAEKLAKKLLEKSCDGKSSIEIEPDANKAALLALEKGAGYDVILFAGSLYLIGKIRGVLKNGDA